MLGSNCCWKFIGGRKASLVERRAVICISGGACINGACTDVGWKKT
ncbi:hypothetical protein M758_4G171900 [Ceratodon purpureus]|nr:hypothetical protein M758_4G171900 [Ceratodon purpureus]